MLAARRAAAPAAPLALRPGAAGRPAGRAPSRTRAHVDALASPKLEGRLTGSPGANAAAAYIEAELKRIGAKPLPGASSFRVPFGFTSGITNGGSEIRMPVTNGDRRRYEVPTDVLALSFSESGDVTAPVVFAGYGLRVPAADGGGFVYDSYAGLDVKDKIVLVLRYMPEKAEREQREQHVRFSALRYKALAARQARREGAARRVGAELDPAPAASCRSRYDTAAASSGIVAASIGGDVADALFARAGKSLKEAQDALDAGNPHVAGFALGDQPRDHRRQGRAADTPPPTTSPATCRRRAPSPASPSRG